MDEPGEPASNRIVTAALPRFPYGDRDISLTMDSYTGMSGDTEETQNKLINEEYKIWKKNSVFLYDIMYRWAQYL